MLRPWLQPLTNASTATARQIASHFHAPDRKPSALVRYRSMEYSPSRCGAAHTPQMSDWCRNASFLRLSPPELDFALVHFGPEVIGAEDDKPKDQPETGHDGVVPPLLIERHLAEQ